MDRGSFEIPKVTILIASFNGIRYLPYLLDSIFKQSFNDFRVLIIDNGSEDGTVSYIRKNYPQVSLIENRKNLGFSKAYNKGISLSKSDYVLVANQDIILDQKFLENIIKHAEGEPGFASFGGKLLRYQLEEVGPQMINSFDSIGLKGFRSRRFLNIGEGEEDNGQFNLPKELFGISGALTLYRKQALNEVRIGREYFDEDFFMYKEDIDLAWRLRNLGYRALYVPEAIAYHSRSIRLASRENIKSIMSGRKIRGEQINKFSYRNHLALLVKNESLINLLVHFFWIFIYEFQKFLYLLIFEIKTLSSLFYFWKLVPKMLKKRKYIFFKRKVSDEEMRKWFK